MTELQGLPPDAGRRHEDTDCGEASSAQTVPATRMRRIWRLIWRILVAIVGSAVVLAGIGLSIPLIPGPGFAVIIAGLAILATEFSGPRRLLRWLPRRIRQWKAERARRQAR